MSLKSECSN